MYGTLDISTSALIAHRTRLDVISANIANANTILNSEGQHEPFQRRVALLAASDQAYGDRLGVHVSEIAVDYSEPRMVYEPGSPYANAEGYVAYPNVDTVLEQVNAMEAARAYEANVAAIEATKSMISVALQILG